MTGKEPALDGERLQGMRKRRRLTAKQLADQAGISSRHIWRLEAGLRPNVAAVTLARLALALDVDVYYLLGLTDEPERKEG